MIRGDFKMILIAVLSIIASVSCVYIGHLIIQTGGLTYLIMGSAFGLCLGGAFLYLAIMLFIWHFKESRKGNQR